MSVRVLLTTLLLAPLIAACGNQAYVQDGVSVRDASSYAVIKTRLSDRHYDHRFVTIIGPGSFDFAALDGSGLARRFSARPIELKVTPGDHAILVAFSGHHHPAPRQACLEFEAKAGVEYMVDLDFGSETIWVEDASGNIIIRKSWRNHSYGECRSESRR